MLIFLVRMISCCCCISTVQYVVRSHWYCFRTPWRVVFRMNQKHDPLLISQQSVRNVDTFRTKLLFVIFYCHTSTWYLTNWTIITVWTVVQTMLTATFNSYGDRQISTPYKINTPEKIDKKFGTVDYVRKGTPYTKFGTNPPTEGFWANGWNITKIIFIYPFFSQARAQVRPVDGFLHAIAQKTWNYARMCLLGVWTMCPSILGVKLPQKTEILGAWIGLSSLNDKNFKPL